MARQRQAAREWQAKHPTAGDPFARAYAREWQRDYLSDPKNRKRVNARRRERAAMKRALVVARGEHKRLYPRPFGPRKQRAA